MRLTQIALLFVLTGCIHHPNVVTDGDQFELASRRYPQPADRSDSFLPPRQPLESCHDSILSGWLLTPPSWPSMGIPLLHIPVPRDWHPVDLAPAARMSRQSGAVIDSAAHIIGIWESPMPGASLRLATDSVPGYQLTVIGGKSRQTAVEECGLGDAAFPGRVVVATVVGQSRDILLVALWRFDEHHWLKATGRGKSASDSIILRAMVAGIHP